MSPAARRAWHTRLAAGFHRPAWQRRFRQLWRRIHASGRDTVLLFRQFRLPLLFFVIAVVGSGLLYQALAPQPKDHLRSPVEAIYITMLLTFLQPTVDFPDNIFLQIMFFVLPVVGISVLAAGLADFGVMLFNRHARSKEWEMAVASTMSNHVVVVGLGHLGFRVVKKLAELYQDVVVIEQKPEADLLHNVREMGVPVIADDGTRETVLSAAGVQRARAIILCTQNDSLNLRMALKARGLNPKIEVVIRIFDEEFATSLESQFGFHAMSATSMAAPLFAAIAAHIDMTPPITIAGQPHILANLQVTARSPMCGMTVLALEETYHLSVVLLCRDGERLFHPAGNEPLLPGQTVAVFGQPENINQIVHERDN